MRLRRPSWRRRDKTLQTVIERHGRRTPHSLFCPRQGCHTSCNVVIAGRRFVRCRYESRPLSFVSRPRTSILSGNPWPPFNHLNFDPGLKEGPCIAPSMPRPRPERVVVCTAPQDTPTNPIPLSPGRSGGEGPRSARFPPFSQLSRPVTYQLQAAMDIQLLKHVSLMAAHGVATYP